jgi:purine-binding chemotaxis protein CheW
MHTPDQAPASATTDFLSFRLGGLDYALEFSKVEELRVLTSLERFSSEGEIINGVALSRGVIMPIVDMRASMPERQRKPDPQTDVIILKLSTCVLGMVVDGVTDVVKLRAEQISPVPTTDRVAADYLLGLAELDGRRLILIDIDKLMSVQRGHSNGARQSA